jgi:hypothetical protein
VQIETLNLFSTVAAAQVFCPPGKRIKILGVLCNVAGLAQGEEVTITLSRGGDIMFQAVTNPLLAGIGTVSAFIGAHLTTALLDSTVVATGVATYNTQPINATAPLPDATFPYSLDVSVTVTAGSLGSFRVTYEVLG